MNATQSRRGVLVFFTLAASVTAGCTAIPTSRFDLLAESGESTLKAAENVFSRMESIQLVECVVRARTKPLSEDVFKPGDLDLAPRLRLRQSTLEVLARYLELLKELAEKDFQGDIDAASDKLAASAKSLTAQLAPSDDKLSKVGGIFASLVEAVGAEIVREKRIRALEKAMSRAQRDLVEVCSLVSHDVRELKAFMGLMKTRIYSNFDAVRPQEKDYARLVADRELAQILSEFKDLGDALDGLGRAVLKIPDAHQETLQALETPERPREALKALISKAQQIGKFYQHVK